MTITHAISPRLLQSVYAAVFVIASPVAVLPQTLIPQGPSYSFGSTDTVQSGDQQGSKGTVSGGVQAIVLDPYLGANTMFIGSPNGGIWETTNGGASWTTTTSNAASLSIASLGLDSTDKTGNTLIAGLGTTSNGAWGSLQGNQNQGSQFRGNPTTGLLYSTDGGVKWTGLQGTTAFAGQSVIGTAARGDVILAATFEEENPQQMQSGTSGPAYGLYRSVNKGLTFNLVTNGLPSGPVTALVADPNNSNTFYASVTSTTPANTGVYISTNGGANWNAVFKPPSPGSQLIPKVTTGPNGSVAIALASYNPSLSPPGWQLQLLYLSQDQGKTWTQLTAPAVNSGGQGIVNLAVAIDPSNTGVVYVAGDGTGVNPYTVSAFRVDASGVTPLTDAYEPGSTTTLASVYAGGTTAHADSRTLVVNAGGTLLMGGDGGVYLRTNPLTNGGVWQGLNSETLDIRETYTAVYGANAHRIAVAAQDTGVAIQSKPNSSAYYAIQGGDGWNAVVSDKTPGMSMYYTSSQNLGSLSRLVIGNNGQQISQGDPNNPYYTNGVSIQCSLAGSTDWCQSIVVGAAANFQSPFVLNKVDPTRIALAGTTLYTTQDNALPASDSVNLIISPVGAAGEKFYFTTLIYGTTVDPDLILTGTNGNKNQNLFFSNDAPSNLTMVSSYGGKEPTSLVFDQRFGNRFYVADGSNVYASTPTTVDEKISSTITINPLTLPAGLGQPTAIEYINNNRVNALLVGGLGNSTTSPIAVADSLENGNLKTPVGAVTPLRSFGLGLPNVLISQMSYNPTADVLAVATAGRGAWTLYDVTSYFPQALVLQYGLADNDSSPDAKYLVNGNDIDTGEGFSRSLDKEGSGVLTIAGAATYTGPTTVNGGVLNVTGSIVSPVAVNSGAELTGSGSVGATSINAGGALVPGAGSVGTLTINGGYNQNSGATLGITASPQGATKLQVNGPASLNGALQVQLAPSYVPAIGASFPFLTVSGGGASVTGSFASLSQPANGLPTNARLDLVYAPTSVTLDVTAQSYFALAAMVPLNANAQALAAALDRARPLAGQALTGAQATIFYTLYGQPDISGDAAALSSMSGQGHAAAPGALMDAYAGFSSVIANRQAMLAFGLGNVHAALTPNVALSYANGVGPNVQALAGADGPFTALAPAGTGPRSPLTTWGQVYGGAARVGEFNSLPGANASTGGLAVGGDGAFAPNFVAGGAFGFAHTSADSVANTTATGNTYAGALYATWTPGPLVFDGRLATGPSTAGTSRSIAFPGEAMTASGSTNGWGGLAAADAGYRFDLMGASFKPFVGLTGLTFSRSAFTETTDFGLSFPSQSFNRVTSEVGVWATKLIHDDAATFLLQAKASWTNDFGNDGLTTQAALLGVPFTIAAANPGRSAAVVTVNLVAWRTEKLALFVQYQGEFRSNATSNQGSIGVRMTW